MPHIETPSPWLMPVRTPLWVTGGTALADTTGALAVWYILVTGSTSAGHTITVQYGGVTVTLTCVTGVVEADLAPDTFLAAGIDGPQSALNIAGACRRNYELNRDFVVTTSGGTIVFTQRTQQLTGSSTPNSSFNLLLLGTTPSVWAAGDITTSGGDGSTVPNHSVRLAIYSERAGGGFVRLPERSCSIVKGS